MGVQRTITVWVLNFLVVACLAFWGSACDSSTSESGQTTAKQTAPQGPPPIPAKLQGRTLHFPADHSLGALKVRKVGSTRIQDWQQSSDAKGDVGMMQGMEAMLQIGADAVGDLSSLDALPPDALQEIVFEKTDVSDDQLAHLAHLTGLVGLNLDETSVSDAGLAHLADLKSLEKLALGGTRVTDSGLARLEEMTSLKKLWLHNTHITDAGLSHLTALPHLERLILSKTGVTDAGLAELAKIPTLQVLVLQATEISDGGLETIKNFKSLNEIELAGTKVTMAGVQQAKAVLPNCTFHFP